MPHISTQHGVKGESHTSVIFVASDNGNTPNVRMYPFSELWSELEFSLPQFEELFYSYKKIIEEVEKELGMKVSTEGMPIQLIMFEDRIEIHNPGGLYGRITIDQLGKIQPDTRNPGTCIGT